MSTGSFCTLKCKNIPRLVAKDCLKTKCSALGLDAGRLLRHCGVYINKSGLVSFKQILKPLPCNARVLKSKVQKNTRKCGILQTGCLHVFFLYTFLKQRKWQDGNKWPCLYNFTTKTLRLSRDVSSMVKKREHFSCWQCDLSGVLW